MSAPPAADVAGTGAFDRCCAYKPIVVINGRCCTRSRSQRVSKCFCSQALTCFILSVIITDLQVTINVHAAFVQVYATCGRQKEYDHWRGEATKGKDQTLPCTKPNVERRHPTSSALVVFGVRRNPSAGAYGVGMELA